MPVSKYTVGARTIEVSFGYCQGLKEVRVDERVVFTEDRASSSCYMSKEWRFDTDDGAHVELLQNAWIDPHAATYHVFVDGVGPGDLSREAYWRAFYRWKFVLGGAALVAAAVALTLSFTLNIHTNLINMTEVGFCVFGIWFLVVGVYGVVKQRQAATREQEYARLRADEDEEFACHPSPTIALTQRALEPAHAASVGDGNDDGAGGTDNTLPSLALTHGDGNGDNDERTTAPLAATLSAAAADDDARLEDDAEFV